MTIIHLPVLARKDAARREEAVQDDQAPTHLFESQPASVHAEQALQHSKRHVPGRKSWEFLSEYLHSSQSRCEQMKQKIVEAATTARHLDVIAAAERAERDVIASKEKALAEEKKKLAERNDYERPQAQAQADAFLSASKEHFALAAIYENLNDSTTKAFKMKLKMTINRRTGQITDSLQQIKSIAGDLVQLCFQSRNTTRQAYSYCLVLLASKFLVFLDEVTHIINQCIQAQAETQISLHPPSAFPMALVAVELATSVVEFPAILMSALIRKCCFSIPRYPRRTSTDEAYKRDCGFLVVDGVVRESETAFFERMSGLISFFAAIVQTTSLSGKPNVLGLNLGWSWLAAVLNLPPRPITPLLLVSFLEQAAYSLYHSYGVNFEKLLRFILDRYIGLIPQSCIASRTRLELLCKETLSAGRLRVKEPVGRKMTH